MASNNNVNTCESTVILSEGDATRLLGRLIQVCHDPARMTDPELWNLCDSMRTLSEQAPGFWSRNPSLLGFWDRLECEIALRSPDDPAGPLVGVVA